MKMLRYSKNLPDKQLVRGGGTNHTNFMIDLFKHDSILQGEKMISGGIEWNSGCDCQDIP